MRDDLPDWILCTGAWLSVLIVALGVPYLILSYLFG